MSPITVVCPACAHQNFNIQHTGLIFRKKIYTCEACGTSLQQIKFDEFEITGLGDTFSLVAPYYLNKIYSPYQLHHQTIYPDQTISNIRCGEQAELDRFFIAAKKQFKTLPVELNEGEQLAVRLLYLVYATSNEKIVPTGLLAESYEQLNEDFMSLLSLPYCIPNAINHNVDIGELMVTTERLIFESTDPKIEVPLTSITGVIPYRNGLQVFRESPDPPIFFKNNDSEWVIVAAVIEGLLQTYAPLNKEAPEYQVTPLYHAALESK